MQERIDVTSEELQAAVENFKTSLDVYIRDLQTYAERLVEPMDRSQVYQYAVQYFRLAANFLDQRSTAPGVPTLTPTQPGSTSLPPILVPMPGRSSSPPVLGPMPSPSPSPSVPAPPVPVSPPSPSPSPPVRVGSTTCPGCGTPVTIDLTLS
jgi:hypothetical protein